MLMKKQRPGTLSFLIDRMKNLTPTIGLEIHLELKTASKMFCGCPSDHFGKSPNAQTCPVCLGLPGALPIPNKKAIEWTIMLGLALHSNINLESKFDRKHYFYPDLPKGYQISQYDEPFCLGGFLETNEGKVGITRVHLEEDTGKLQHKIIDGRGVSLVDFNRSGVPLVEIVSEPDIHSASQAKEYAQELQKIIRYLDISDCDMEKGSMRLEANISWGLGLGYKVEVKNINSFRFMEKAINYELNRQKKLLESGETPRQETRGWNETKNETTTQRYKETAADYRYFPEPDIPPLLFSQAYVDSIKEDIPELPEQISRKFVSFYKIKQSYAKILSENKELAAFSQRCFDFIKDSGVEANNIASYLVNKKINFFKEDPEDIVNQLAKTNKERVIDESKLSNLIETAILEEKKAAADVINGKIQAIGVLVGAVMKLSKGRADAKIVHTLLLKKLKPQN